MRIENVDLVVGTIAWVFLILHTAAVILALCERRPWLQRFFWAVIAWSVPLLGPLYYLLFVWRGGAPESEMQPPAEYDDDGAK